jgi:hypothetical protein
MEQKPGLSQNSKSKKLQLLRELWKDLCAIEPGKTKSENKFKDKSKRYHYHRVEYCKGQWAGNIKFVNILEHCGLNSPTHQAGHCLDMVVCHKDYPLKPHTYHTGFSDHYDLLFSIPSHISRSAKMANFNK